jgi:hypothetical protein
MAIDKLVSFTGFNPKNGSTSSAHINHIGADRD